MTILPVGDYRPDVPAYLGTHATVATNVFPRPDGSDGPLKAATVVATGLSGQPVSAYMARSGDGTVYQYVAVAYANTINRKYGSTYAGFFTGSSGGGATVLFPWRFTQFGERLVAVNPASGLWYHTITTTNNFTQATAAPRAAFIATIEPGFVMLGRINDGTERPAGLRWSAINDGTDWPVVGTSDAASKQSDDQDLPNGGAVTGILAAVGGGAACVLTERSVYRVDYIGAPSIFSFREIIRGSGNICPNGAIAVRGIAYYVSEEGFQRFDGQAETPIGLGRVSRTFLDSVDRENLHRVYVAHEPNRKLLVWAYPDTTATNGNPNRWLIYSYATDKWRYSDDPGIECCLIFTAQQDGTSLDLIASPDSMTSTSMDSTTIGGGSPLLAGFNTSNQFVTYTGATLAALVETGETDDKGRRVFVSGLRPLTDAAAPTAAVGYRDTFNASIAYTSLTGIEATGVCPQRINTRYARARVYIPAAATWTYLQGVDVQMQRAGKR